MVMKKLTKKYYVIISINFQNLKKSLTYDEDSYSSFLTNYFAQNSLLIEILTTCVYSKNNSHARIFPDQKTANDALPSSFKSQVRDNEVIMPILWEVECDSKALEKIYEQNITVTVLHVCYKFPKKEGGNDDKILSIFINKSITTKYSLYCNKEKFSIPIQNVEKCYKNYELAVRRLGSHASLNYSARSLYDCAQKMKNINHELVRDFLIAAAEKKNLTAMYELGRYYCEGKNKFFFIEQNERKGITYLNQVKNSGDEQLQKQVEEYIQKLSIKTRTSQNPSSLFGKKNEVTQQLLSDDQLNAAINEFLQSDIEYTTESTSVPINTSSMCSPYGSK